MDKRIMEPLDGEQVVLVARWTTRISIRAGMRWRRWPTWTKGGPGGGSVRSAMDNVIMPTMQTIFDRITEGSRAPDSSRSSSA